MKIIGKDNWDRDCISDTLVAENIQDNEFATVMCDSLNAKLCTGNHSPLFFVVKPDDYKPYVFEP